MTIYDIVALSVSSHDFILGFPKGVVTMEKIFFVYNPMIIP